MMFWFERYPFKKKVVMLLGLGVWKMMVVVVDMVTHNSLSLIGLDASPSFNDAIVIIATP